MHGRNTFGQLSIVWKSGTIPTTVTGVRRTTSQQLVTQNAGDGEPPPWMSHFGGFRRFGQSGSHQQFGMYSIGHGAHSDSCIT
jgi:hypothetical protein